MDEQLKKNLTSTTHWTRFLYMVLFVVCLQVSSLVMWVLVAVQFMFALITGRDNLNCRQLGDTLSQYIYQCFRFVTYVSDEKPFPFADWPVSDIHADNLEESSVSEAPSAVYEEEQTQGHAYSSSPEPASKQNASSKVDFDDIPTLSENASNKDKGTSTRAQPSGDNKPEKNTEEQDGEPAKS